MDCVYEIEIKVPFSPISDSAGIHEMEGSLGGFFFLFKLSVADWLKENVL